MTQPLFQLSCESTVDLPCEYVAGRDISVIFYSYVVDGAEYDDDMGRDPAALPRFYGFLDAGKLPSTSQINAHRYEEYFRRLLEKGDVLHIAFSSGLTPSVENARAAAEQLRGEFPDRRIVVVDSLCGSAGYGLLVDSAADRRDEGCTLDETARWAEENRLSVQHRFFSTDLSMFRRSGRLSLPASAVASALGICPLMRLDEAGRIVVCGKARGKKAAVRETVDAVRRLARGGADYGGRVFVAHSDCEALARETAEQLAAVFPKLRKPVRICDIGTIIASHCGAGTVAVFFFGEPRGAEE